MAAAEVDQEGDESDYNDLSSENEAERDGIIRQILESDSGSEFELEGFDRDVIRAALARRVTLPIEQQVGLEGDGDDGWSAAPLVDPVRFIFDPNDPGIQGDIGVVGETPKDFFDSLFNVEMWDCMTEQTNIYADRKMQGPLSLREYSCMKKWTPVTVPELKVFFALTILTGLVHKADLEKFWSQEAALATPYFADHMSRDRFQAILSNFHLVDNERAVPRGQDAYDPLYKVRPFMTMVQTNIKDAYIPERDLSFDEGSCPWKGRLGFRVYNPTKPERFHIKFYEVCEASSGYVVGFDMYTGVTGTRCTESANPIDPDCTTTTNVVLGLLRECDLLGKGYHVYMDNYYSSPELATELDSELTYVCGTERKNRRGLPAAVTGVRLRPGETIYRTRDNNKLVVKHHDKREILMLSTIHDAMLNILHRQPHGREGAPLTKPTCICDYIVNMRGVDLSDQLLQYYSVLRRTVKWWLKLYLHLLNILITDAYILYKKSNGTLSQHDFRLDLAKMLVADAGVDAPRPKRPGRTSVDKPCRLQGRHFPAPIEPKDGAKRRNPMRDCVGCNRSAKHRVGYKRKQSHYECRKCQVVLCISPCFEAYHTYTNYKSMISELLSQSESDSESQD